MAHSPLLSKLISISRLAEATRDDAVDYDAALAIRQGRRDFLKATAATGAATMMAGVSLQAEAASYKPARIAIIGAGLAGLRCAYELKKIGISPTIYEANPSRIGGRCFSNRTSFGANVAENGGELIDTPQTNIQDLAAELGLVLDDCGGWAAALGVEELYFVNGHKYTYADAFNDWKKVAAQFNRDAKLAPFPQTWDSYTQRGAELDQMTVAEYIDTYVPGGRTSDFGKILDVAFNIEFGAQTDQQSAYGMISLIGGQSTKGKHPDFYWFGASDERFHIRGGNDQLVTGMAAKLDSGQIVRGHALSKIVLNSDKTYTLSFTTAAGAVKVIADHVVMAIPFSILRSSVDFGGAGFDARKKLAITRMPMGNNVKFQLQFNRRVWHDVKCSGETYSDLGYQDTWEVSRAQPTTTAVINNYTGGNNALRYADATDLNLLAKDFLAQWEHLVPGCTAEWNGKMVLNNWPKNIYTKGAYGYYAPGNYTSFVGYEGVRQGNCHFCGEHTSITNQGYLEGAVETGERCANELKNDLKKA